MIVDLDSERYSIEIEGEEEEESESEGTDARPYLHWGNIQPSVNVLSSPYEVIVQSNSIVKPIARKKRKQKRPDSRKKAEAQVYVAREVRIRRDRVLPVAKQLSKGAIEASSDSDLSWNPTTKIQKLEEKQEISYLDYVPTYLLPKKKTQEQLEEEEYESIFQLAREARAQIIEEERKEAEEEQLKKLKE